MGYDAGNEVKGRKIHALVDTEALPMRVVVHSAAVQDRDGAGLVLDKIRRRFPWLELIWADGGYTPGKLTLRWQRCPLLRMEIVKRSDDMKGFVVLPRRAAGWSSTPFPGSVETGVSPRIPRTLPKLWPTFVTLTSIQLALRRLARA